MSKFLFQGKNVSIFKNIFYRIEPLFNDKLAIKIFALALGYGKINLRTPKTFQDKINYLKINYRYRIVTEFSDKLLAKKYIQKEFPFIKTPKVLQTFDDVFEINLKLLPDKFVIKSNYSSGDIKIIHNKDSLDLKNLSAIFDYSKLKSPYQSYTREWGYKEITRKFFIEEYLETEDGLTDYKFFCFNGNVPFLHVVEDRFKNLKDYIIDTNWENLNFNFSDRSYEPVYCPPKPKNFSLMLKTAQEISKNFPFIRIDFYEHKGNVYFSEFTFYPWGGFFKFQPKSKAEEIDNFVSGFLNINFL